MLTNTENDLLTRVTGDAPMASLMRQHWTPVCLIEEVEDCDGTPILCEVLGTRYVAFRDSDGRVGLLDELCPHRRASLLYGRNEECGLRCLYHGWKFDVDGNTMAMNSEPEDSPLIDKVKHRAYPTKEWGGFVWAWLGSKEDVPEFQPPVFAPTQDSPISILKINIPCNWAQVMEGQIDSAHSSSLHSSDMVPARVEEAGADEKRWYRPSTDKSPRLQAEATDYGFHYAAIRRPIKNPDTHQYVRVTEYIAPYYALIPPNSSYNVATVIVPIDDESCSFHFISWGTNEILSTEEWRKYTCTQKGIDLDDKWRPLRNEENSYMQDRQAMKLGNFSGITGIPNQDIAMWVSQGPIADRSKDTLGSSDLGIVEFRRIMVEAARQVAAGEPAIGTGPSRVDYTKVNSRQKVIEKTLDWRMMGNSDG